MVWQGLISFAIWLAVGAWLAIGARGLRFKVLAMRRREIALASAALLFIGAGLLLGAFAALGGKGLEGGRMVPLAWLAVTTAGLVFVSMQTLAFALLATLVQSKEPSGQHKASGASDDGGNQW